MSKLVSPFKSSGLKSLVSGFGNGSGSYDLLEFDDVDGNIKMIGDRIVEKIRKDYIDSNPNNTPEKIKAQIKKDLLAIYYENAGERKVKENIKDKVCKAWFTALRTRYEIILKDVILLLNKEDIKEPTEQEGGGELFSKLTNSVPNMLKNPVLNSSSSREPILNTTSSVSSGIKEAKAADSKPVAKPVPKPVPKILTEKEKQAKQEENNKLYLEKLIEYKSKLFEVENFEKRPLQRSATVSQVYDLHESIISKILCNYAVIKRDILVGELRKIILGDNGIELLEEYKRSKKWFKSSNEEQKSEEPNAGEKDSVYQSFIKKITDLGDTEKYNEKSNPIVVLPPPQKKEASEESNTTNNAANTNGESIAVAITLANNMTDSGNNGEKIKQDENITQTQVINGEEPNDGSQQGGKVSKKIPEYIPSTYVWEKIRGYVEERLQILIQENVSLSKEKTDGIKEGFQEVYLQVNCDCLDLVSEKNEKITDYLNHAYHSILDYLCKNIPDKYAARILQSYILRNFGMFSEYLETIFKEDVGFIESYFLGYRNIPSKMIEDTKVKPVYPKIKREEIPKDADYDALDNCCDDRKGDKDLNAEGVSGFLKTENVGKTPSITDQFTPSILLPAFNVYKKVYNECSDNVDFLAVIFNMYSGRSIKFMQQIQQQFSHEGVNDFIERYILTKHPYTTKIISACIKHGSDIKFTLSENAKKNVQKDDKDGEEDETKKTEINVDTVKLVSQYVVFLMHSSSDLSLNIDTSSQNAYIDFIKNKIEPFSVLCEQYSNFQLDHSNIITSIADNAIPENKKGDYNKSLRTVFNVNKTFLKSAKKFTRKARVGFELNKRYLGSLFDKKKTDNSPTNIDQVEIINPGAKSDAEKSDTSFAEEKSDTSPAEEKSGTNATKDPQIANQNVDDSTKNEQPQSNNETKP